MRWANGGAGFCHTGDWSCFGPAEGLRRLERTLKSRRASAVPGSLTHRLLSDPAFLGGKLVEEAGELGDAVLQLGESMGERDGGQAEAGEAMAEGNAAPQRDRVVEEAADVMYFLTVALERAGVSLADVERELDRRSMKVVRRAASAPKGAAGEQGA